MGEIKLEMIIPIVVAFFMSLPGILNFIRTWRKDRAEGVAIVKGGEKDDAEATDFIVTAATSLLDPYMARVEKLEGLTGELEKQLKLRKKLTNEKAEKEAKARNRTRQSLERQVEVGQRRVRRLVGEIQKQEQLILEGLITEKKLADTWQQLENTENEIAQNVSQIMQLEAEEAESELVDETEYVKLVNDIKEKKREIFSVELKLDLLSKVVSPFTGRVIDNIYCRRNLIHCTSGWW